MESNVESRNHTFSHSSRINRVKHKFSVGELAFIKMKNELCLVFIHYLSQKLVFCACTVNEKTVVPIGLSAYDGESIYHDYKSHMNHLNESRIELNRIHGYYIPMYFISFPGYRRKCSKFFRFWIKECDLIPYNSVRNRLTDKPTHKLEDISQALKEALEESEVENIDNYVYGLERRCIDISKHFLSGINSITALPWHVSDWMKCYMNKELIRIVNIDWGMDIFCNFLCQSENLDEYERVIEQVKLFKCYSSVPFYRKFNARAVANEFKFYVLLLAKILLKTEGKQVKLWKKQVKISYRAFVAYYVSQLYWIDLMLDWLDVNFIDSCCYCKEERVFLLSLLNSYRQQQANSGSGIDFMADLIHSSMASDYGDWGIKPSDLLGINHLARLLCYPIFYNNYINDLTVDGVNIGGLSLPIYQLFLSFIAYSIKDYTRSQEYSLD